MGWMNVLKQFRDYLDHGFYPFYKEDVSGYHARLREVVKLVLEVDLPAIEEVEVGRGNKIPLWLFGFLY